jgi:lipoprotein-anchoring transpeptidase ErfK/SrfK
VRQTTRPETEPWTRGVGLRPARVRAALIGAAAVALVALTASVAAAGPKPRPRVPPDAIVAEATVPSVVVYDHPGAVTPTRALSNPNRYRGRLVLLVSAVRLDGWLRVLLPVRPNGTLGWVHAGDVVLTNDPYRVVIQLRAHRITVTKRGSVILREPVAVGKPNTPTPGGGYYLTQLFAPSDPNGPYGPDAYSLSGYSEVLTTFEGGDAIIGLHGTNHPELLGHDVSSGCIRMRNEAITRLAGVLPLGTPVAIVP